MTGMVMGEKYMKSHISTVEKNIDVYGGDGKCA